jgi:hypothetical protein
MWATEGMRKMLGGRARRGKTHGAIVGQRHINWPEQIDDNGAMGKLGEE